MAFLNEQGLQHLVDKINVRSSKILPDNAPDGTIIIDPDEDTEIFNVSMDVDTALSATSTNPVQNKVVTEALANIEVDTATNSEIDAALNLAEIGVLPENGVVPVSMGGTGAVTATEARANLGASATTDFASIAFTGSYKDLNDKPAFALINNTVLSGLTVVDNLEIKNALNIPGGQIWIE